MFTTKICLTIVVLSVHAANSYILLTANLDDVHSLVKQIAASPVVKQFDDIVNHAALAFNQNQAKERHRDTENKAHMRTDPELDEVEPHANGKRRKTIHTSDINQSQLSQEEESSAKSGKSDEPPENDSDVWTPDQKAIEAELDAKMSDSSSDGSNEMNDIKPHHVVRRDSEADVAELGRNASFYLTSIKKIFENV